MALEGKNTLSKTFNFWPIALGITPKDAFS
jgi:hypothetical protein